MSRKRQTAVVTGLFALPLVALVLYSCLWKARDGYRFLGGRTPVLTTIEGEMGGGGGGYDVHIYSWREDFYAARSRAHAELTKLGFKEALPKPSKDPRTREMESRMIFWSKGERDRYVVMTAGRSSTYKQAMNGPTADTSWVTVTVGAYMPDGPLVWIRRALPHQED
jgi:hypothetical protein